MKKFSEFLNEHKAEQISQKCGFIVWYDTQDAKAAEQAALLIEGGNLIKIDNRYSCRHDRGLQPNQQDHTHIYLKGLEVCVVNADGTPSHRSAPFSTLPPSIQAKIRQYKLVEMVLYLTEENSPTRQIIPKATVAALSLQLNRMII